MNKSVINSSQDAPFYTNFLKKFLGEHAPGHLLASLRAFAAR